MRHSRPHPPGAHVPARWLWHYERLQSLRERLLASRAAEMAEISEPAGMHGIHLPDGATDELDHDLALGLLARNQDALYEVEAAIHRILEGTYGRCEATGLPIPAARLRAVPWTRHTLEAEAETEREPGAETPRLHRP